MPQTHELKRNPNIKVENFSDLIRVRLYDTQIVTVTLDWIRLYTGNWFTSTTRNRMNQVSGSFDLGYRVSTVRGQWIVEYNGYKIPFVGSVCEFKRINTLIP